VSEAPEAPKNVDGALRAKMRALAVRGGAATKQKADAGYYRAIGRIGGKASGAARTQAHESRPETAPDRKQPTEPSAAMLPVEPPRTLP